MYAFISHVTTANEMTLADSWTHAHSTRCSQRRQTSPPVPPPGERDETLRNLWFWPIHSIMWKGRHPQH